MSEQEPNHRLQWRWYSPRQDSKPVTIRELEGLAPAGQLELLRAIKAYCKGGPVTTKHIMDGIYEIKVRVGNDHFRAYFFKDSPVHAICLRVEYKNQQKTGKSTKTVLNQRRDAWETERKKDHEHAASSK